MCFELAANYQPPNGHQVFLHCCPGQRLCNRGLSGAWQRHRALSGQPSRVHGTPHFRHTVQIHWRHLKQLGVLQQNQPDLFAVDKRYNRRGQSMPGMVTHQMMKIV